MKTKLRSVARHAVLVAAALFIVSCGREAPTAVQQQPSSDLLGGLTKTVSGVLACSPLPAASATALIGPSGGVMQIGPHVFTVPAGALTTTVQITATAPSGSANVVNFQPQGLRFAQPAYLTLSFANCSLVASLLPQIAYVDNSLDILAYIPSLASFWTRTVTGKVSHFSGYAVAY